MQDQPSPSLPLTGGCQCGAVRYRLTALPSGASVCHCRMCQKAGGGPFMVFGSVPTDKIEWTRGAPTIFRSSSLAERGFCSACGTPLTYQAGPRRISLTLGSLDQPAAVAPAAQLGIESRLPWVSGIADLPAQTTDMWLKQMGAEVITHQHPDHDT